MMYSKQQKEKKIIEKDASNLSLYNSLLGPGQNTPNLNLCTLGFAQYKPSLYFCPVGANQYNLCCFSLIECHWRLMLWSLHTFRISWRCLGSQLCILNHRAVVHSWFSRHDAELTKPPSIIRPASQHHSHI